nr:hypothetical protein [Tanacetum cinerariifolium]
MNTIQAQQKALNDTLVAPVDHLEFKKCNMRLKTDIKPKETIFQVVLDALALTPLYYVFLITVDVPAIYMQEFWAIVLVHRLILLIRFSHLSFGLNYGTFSSLNRVLHGICVRINFLSNVLWFWSFLSRSKSIVCL